MTELGPRIRTVKLWPENKLWPRIRIEPEIRIQHCGPRKGIQHCGHRNVVATARSSESCVRPQGNGI